MNPRSGPRPGNRTDVACPRCGGRMGGLYVRPDIDGSTAQVPIGRACDECGLEELKPIDELIARAAARPGAEAGDAAEHLTTTAVSKRTPRPASSYRAYPIKRFCRDCGRLVEPLQR